MHYEKGGMSIRMSHSLVNYISSWDHLNWHANDIPYTGHYSRQEIYHENPAEGYDQARQLDGLLVNEISACLKNLPSQTRCGSMQQSSTTYTR